MIALAALTVGGFAGVTTTPPVFVAEPKSGLVTVMSRAPVSALESMLMFAVTCVAPLYVVELTWMPSPA